MSRSRKRDASPGLGGASIDTGRRASAYEQIKEAIRSHSEPTVVVRAEVGSPEAWRRRQS